MFKKYKYSEIENIIFELLNEKAVIIPTDTIIGILSKNINLIYDIKKRSKHKKIITFLPNKNELTNLNFLQKEFINKFWPGQVTIIYKGISYRIPNDKYLLYILNKTGPLYCSSANVSAEEPITNTDECNNVFNVKKYYQNLVYVEGSTTNNEPSSIVDIDSWKIIRQGTQFTEITDFINTKVNAEASTIILLDQELYSKKKYILNHMKKRCLVQKATTKNIDTYLNKIVDKKNIDDLLIVTKKPTIFDEYANKHKFIRSAIIYNNDVAILSKQHDNTNVAIFDYNEFNLNAIIFQMNLYLGATFEGGRHTPRVQTIIDYENEH